MSISSAGSNEVLTRAIKVNTYLFGIVCGLTCAAIFFLATYILLWRGGADHIGEHLSLFSIFLPGYTVTPRGAWSGSFWVAIFSGISGAIVYATYARTLRTEILDQFVQSTDPSDTLLIAPIAKMSGNALGIGLGLMVGLQLILATNWLVVRGTADESHHAALLANFLPGYTVSFAGSLIGAVELFMVAYVVCRVLAAIYNGIVNRKTRNSLNG